MFASSLQEAIQSGIRERRLSSSASSECSSSSSSGTSSSLHSPSPFLSASSSFYQAASQSSFNPNFGRSDPIERLKTIVPKLPDDQKSFQLLVESVTGVMKLESKLYHLEQKTKTYRNGLHGASIPDDLENVDVSAFKHLVANHHNL